MAGRQERDDAVGRHADADHTDEGNSPPPHTPEHLAEEELPKYLSPSPVGTGATRFTLDDGRQGRRFASAWVFPSSLGWTIAGGVVPGSGLIRAGKKRSGLFLLLLGLVVMVVGGLGAWLAPQLLLSLLVLPGVLTGLTIAVAGFGVLWVLSLVATHLMLRPRHPTAGQRLLGAVVVGFMSLIVAVPSFAGARAIHDTSTFISGVLGQDEPAAAGTGDDQPFGNPIDPWANKPRLNVLVLGGDAGPDREGTRTDTVILASIDTHTGDTILFSLPRQTQRMPFPPASELARHWPNGFTAGGGYSGEYALNAIYGNIPAVVPEAIPAGVEDPGAWVLKQTVGEALGLQVDYYAMVNMEGFVEFVNALGGVTVNINRPVPVGGVDSTGTPPDRWLPPGPNQHLNGNDALWYARGRYGVGDYDRMSRQRCTIQAIVDQANPTTVLANYEALSKAGRNIVATDIPNRALPPLLTLALRVKDGTMTSVSFENDKDGFSTNYPDWDVVRERVRHAINPPAPAAPAPGPTSSGTASPQPEEEPSASPSAEESPGATASPEATPASVVDECDYNPTWMLPPEEQRR